MTKTGSRLAVFLFHILIAVLSAAAIFSCVLFPLWRVNVNYLLRAEDLREILPEGGTEEDAEEIVGDGVPVRLTVEATVPDILAFFTSDPAQAAEDFIGRNSDAVVDRLMPVLEELVAKAIRSTAKRDIGRIVREQLKNFLGDAAGADPDARVEELLGKAGIDDAYLIGKTDELLDTLYAENATTDTVATAVLNAVEETYEKLHASNEALQEFTLTEDDKAQIREEADKALAVIADEQGNIDSENIASRLLLYLLRSEADGTRASAHAVLPAAEKDASEKTQPEEDARAELKEEVRQALLERLPQGTAKVVAAGAKIVGGIALFSALTWGYLLLKMLFKLTARNPAIKLKLPIWLGWLPFLLLVLVPTALFFLNASGILPLPGNSPSISQFLSLSFYSGNWIAFAAAVALVVLSVPYSALRRRLSSDGKEKGV